ncbi:two-component response regulator-like APRR1 isoform X1 [Primulina eburnea]|uniref:two-component response regulator-like APRR1 isoform X1 n=1 Tax=Primulina eburnea TaxID=1245227 RepID=UPI003C6C5C2E
MMTKVLRRSLPFCVNVLIKETSRTHVESFMLILMLNIVGPCFPVISVRSPRQVIGALNAARPDFDIILSEVDLPMSRGLKMLKYIMRDKELCRIPVIMMSAQDEVSIVVKCLKFGAADYLVKPLRTNELLNLWTHMWRRRRMVCSSNFYRECHMYVIVLFFLGHGVYQPFWCFIYVSIMMVYLLILHRQLGLADKSIVNCDLVASDPSDANTNNTTLFSDDTDDRSLKGNSPEFCVSTHRKEEIPATTTAAGIETVICDLSVCQPDMPQINDREPGQISVFPNKQLKIGDSSAFFMYIKSTTPNSNSQGPPSVYDDEPQHLKIAEHLSTVSDQVGIEIQQQDNTKTLENHSQGDKNHCSNSVHDSFSAERSCTPVSHDITLQRNSDEHFSHSHVHSRNVKDAAGRYTHIAYPYYIPGIMNQVTMPPASMYHNHTLDIHNHSNPAILSPYNHIPQCPPHVQEMAPYPYYPFGICLQPGQMPVPAPHSWPSLKYSSVNEENSCKVDRREAALMKFRQKRKERCFDKKIRYVNRKKLAERRPRLRGQFVRKVNGIAVDLNGQPASTEEDEEGGEEYDEEEDDS